MENGKTIIIVCTGAGTRIFSEGKVYDNNITGVSFEHKPPNKPEFRIEANTIPIDGSSDLKKIRQAINYILNKNRLPCDEAAD